MVWDLKSGLAGGGKESSELMIFFIQYLQYTKITQNFSSSGLPSRQQRQPGTPKPPLPPPPLDGVFVWPISPLFSILAG